MVRVIPAPREITFNATSFKITSATKIILGNENPADLFAAEQFLQEVSFNGGPELKIVSEQKLRKLPTSYIFIGDDASEFGRELLTLRGGKLTPVMKDEGYFLDANQDGVVIIAHNAKGRFYGVMSLLQLIELQKKSLIAEGVHIHDYPLMKIRGMSDDISRGQVSTVENFKKIIRTLARYKMNTYSPYIEDVFAFKNHPLIGKNRGALTAKEVKDLDRYAKNFHIDLVPVFETLGHWENILLMPEYMNYGEFPGAHTVNVSDEKVYQLLDEMIGELAAAFSSPYFNLAADESWDVGLGANKDRVAASDLATVHAEHYKRLFAMIRKYGKKPIMYGDVILNNPTILDKIPKDVIIVDWHYRASFTYRSPSAFAQAGFPFVVCPAVWNFTCPFPNYLNSFVNIKNLNLEGYRNGSLGIMTSNWTDYGGEALRELNYYGYAWTAECGWQPVEANIESFNRRFFQDFYGSKAADRMDLIYSMLSATVNQFHWHEFWRHPMLPLRNEDAWEFYPPVIVRAQSIQSTMPLVLRELEKAKSEVSKNVDHLAYLTFVAKLNLCFSQKILTSEEVKSLSGQLTSSPANDSLSQLMITKCTAMVQQLLQRKGEFETLWLKTNRAAGLDLLMKRYERQIAYWLEKADEIKKGVAWNDPMIQSQWIYHPSANPGKQDTVQVKKALFKKEISIKGKVRSATVQLIGDTYAQLTVNGKYVGQVFARRSLSLTVENERVKIFDILPFLRDSSNIIAVDVQNYSPSGSAGMNIYGEIIDKNNQAAKVLSDSSWLVTDTQQFERKDFSEPIDGWINAAAKPYPFIVVKPNFATNRPSWIER